MLELLAARDEKSFEMIENQLRPLIKSKVLTFAREPALQKIEDVDSLYNIALVKLHEAFNDFKYEVDLTPLHNEKRFMSLLLTYIKNAMIDIKYANSVDKRMPSGGIVSMTIEFGDSGEEENYELEHKQPEVYQFAHVNDVKSRVMKKLCDGDKAIFDLMSQGFTAESVAGRLGILTSRVRYVLYEKIQPCVREALQYFERND